MGLEFLKNVDHQLLNVDDEVPPCDTVLPCSFIVSSDTFKWGGASMSGLYLYTYDHMFVLNIRLPSPLPQNVTELLLSSTAVIQYSVRFFNALCQTSGLHLLRIQHQDI